jgi:hypothetical protein
MGPFMRPAGKKRRIATAPISSKRPSPTTAGTSAQVTTPPVTNETTPTEQSDVTEPPLDDLDVVRDVPLEELEDGMEQFDNGTAQQAVLTALDEMKLNYGIAVPADELKDARDVLTKVGTYIH